jgi:hypothetical protein
MAYIFLLVFITVLTVAAWRGWGPDSRDLDAKDWPAYPPEPQPRPERELSADYVPGNGPARPAHA